MIGGTEIWFSPIPYTAQLKANETIANENLGTAAVQETKRIALSHSIVGFDQFDLRKYRDAGPVFPLIVVEKEKGGKSVQKDVKVELSKYIYEKLAGWDSELVDTAFDVFADLMESNKKDAVKDVKFENAKDPVDELAEAEARAASLREQLRLPPMVEVSREPAGEPGGRTREELEEDEPLNAPNFAPPDEGEGEGEDAGPVDPDFNPFQPVQTEARGPAPEPVRSVPVPEPQPRELSAIERALEQRGSGPVVARPAVPAQVGSTSSPEKPYEATPSVDVGVVEQQGERQVVDPPKIDRKPGGQSRNPRFSPPGRT